MTTMHPARKRLLIGILLLLGTFFYAFAGTCGLIGELVARISGKLLGQTGSTLLALTMLVTGVLLVVPHGAIGGLFRWALHGREGRVARVVREGDRAVDLQRIVDEAIRRHQLAQKKQAVEFCDEGSHSQGVCSCEAKAKPAAPAPKEPTLTPMQRRKLDMIRGALREQGFKAYEYEPLVAVMDPTKSDSDLLVSALQQLTAN